MLNLNAVYILHKAPGTYKEFLVKNTFLPLQEHYLSSNFILFATFVLKQNCIQVKKLEL
jgi:hypothetical protein